VCRAGRKTVHIVIPVVQLISIIHYVWYSGVWLPLAWNFIALA
jgi:hypothetical protein